MGHLAVLIASAKPDDLEGSSRKTGGEDAIQFSGCGIVLLGGPKKGRNGRDTRTSRETDGSLKPGQRLSGGGCGLVRTGGEFCRPP